MMAVASIVVDEVVRDYKGAAPSVRGQGLVLLHKIEIIIIRGE